jgi:isopentenyl-diphosphate delta-isomerase
MTDSGEDHLIALVDEDDRIIGYEDKLTVHQEGLLHRAFSVVVINSKGQWLMHRRALHKYHSAGSWTNTCCSHLLKGQDMQEAVRTRLLSEMGIKANPVFVDSFHYRAAFENGLTENEIDHVYTALWEGEPKPDPGEVMNWKWCDPAEIEKALDTYPEDFSAWFPLIYELLKNRSALNQAQSESKNSFQQ